MSNYQQNQVSKLVWPWLDPQRGKPVKKPLPRQVRAAIQAVITAGISGLLFLWRPEHPMWRFVLGFSGVVVFSGLFVPPVFLAIEKFGHWFGKNVAIGLNYICLVPFFYLCFTPIRIWHLLTGKDPLALKFPSDLKTYWVPRPPLRNMDQYRKQH